MAYGFRRRRSRRRMMSRRISRRSRLGFRR